MSRRVAYLLDHAKRALDSASEQTRYIDLALRLRVYERAGEGDRAQPADRVSRVYGGRYDTLTGRYVGSATDVLEMPCSAGQLAFVEDQAARSIGLGARGGGKSEGAKLKVMALVLENPGRHGQVISPTMRIGRVIWEKILRDLPGSWIKRVRLAHREIHFANGAVVRFMSGVKPDALRSYDGTWTLVDEAQDVSDETIEIAWLSLRETSHPQLFETATPKRGPFRDRHDRLVESGIGTVHRFPASSNPFIPREVYEIAAQTMDQHLYAQEVLAEWPDDEGLVYWALDYRTHVKSIPETDSGLRNSLNTHWNAAGGHHGRDITRDITRRLHRHESPYIIGMDFNVRPLVAVVYRVFSSPPGASDLMWAIDEVVIQDNANAGKAAVELKRRGYFPAVVFPDATGSRSAGGRSSHRMLKDAGYVVVAGHHNPAVVDRVNAVNSKLRSVSGDVTLLIDPKCSRVLQAMRSQTYAPNGAPAKGRYDHYVDALGYPVALLYPASAAKQSHV